MAKTSKRLYYNRTVCEKVKVFVLNRLTEKEKQTISGLMREVRIEGKSVCFLELEVDAFYG